MLIFCNTIGANKFQVPLKKRLWTHLRKGLATIHKRIVDEEIENRQEHGRKRTKEKKIERHDEMDFYDSLCIISQSSMAQLIFLWFTFRFYNFDEILVVVFHLFFGWSLNMHVYTQTHYKPFDFRSNWTFSARYYTCWFEAHSFYLSLSLFQSLFLGIAAFHSSSRHHWLILISYLLNRVCVACF